VKALKLVINDLRANGESATMSTQNANIDTESEDGVRVIVPQSQKPVTVELTLRGVFFVTG
jgi:hypothetical protein